MRSPRSDRADATDVGAPSGNVTRSRRKGAPRRGDIHPGARIGAGVSIDDGTGVVIEAPTILADRMRRSPMVSLGASNPFDTYPGTASPSYPPQEFCGRSLYGRAGLNRQVGP